MRSGSVFVERGLDIAIGGLTKGTKVRTGYFLLPERCCGL